MAAASFLRWVDHTHEVFPAARRPRRRQLRRRKSLSTTGLVRQDGGVVEVLGRAMPAEQVWVKREVGYVAEDMRLYDQATIGWHMDFVSKPGLIYQRRLGVLNVATTNHYDEEMRRTLGAAGVIISAVEPMSLEEIFLANVQLSRGVA